MGLHSLVPRKNDKVAGDCQISKSPFFLKKDDSVISEYP